MTKEQGGLVALGIALLAALTSWGARETVHVRREDTLTAAVTMYKNDLKQAVDASLLAIKERDLALARSRVFEKHNADGSWERSSDVESRMEQTRESIAQVFKSQIDSLTSERNELKTKVELFEKDTVKAAPFWNVVVEVPLLAVGDYSRWAAGGGVNLGPISLSLVHPLALTLDPRVQGMLRF